MMTAHEVPPERGLPAGRLTELRDELMTRIAQEPDGWPRALPGATPARRRRAALAAAAALAVGAGLATTLVLGGGDSASANTAVRNPDGSITITLREGKHPENLQRRLNDLGVPAVVDFLESGFGCDPARSTGWEEEPAGEALFGWTPTPADSEELVLHPDRLGPGETAVFEFQIDEHEGAIAANVGVRVSTGPVGPCVPVPNDSIVDAERGIAGG
jgi:hypothetical protein